MSSPPSPLARAPPPLFTSAPGPPSRSASAGGTGGPGLLGGAQQPERRSRSQSPTKTRPYAHEVAPGWAISCASLPWVPGRGCVELLRKAAAAAETYIPDPSVQLRHDDYICWLAFEVSNDFRVSVAAPAVYSTLRLRRGVTPADWAAAWAEAGEGEERSSGKSGASFLRLASGRFLVKTLRDTEASLLGVLLPSLNSYLSQNPASLINCPLGLFRVEEVGKKRYFAVFEGLLSAPSMVFDLKGSTHGRECSPEQLRDRNRVPCQKDNEWRAAGLRLEVSHGDAAALRAQLAADARWLESQNLIDYSLLVGIRVGQSGEAEARPEEPNVLPAERSRGMTYHLGLIDWLTEYDGRKVLEHAVKGLVADKDKVSVQPARQYAARFLAFVDEGVLQQGAVAAAAHCDIRMGAPWLSPAAAAGLEQLRAGRARQRPACADAAVATYPPVCADAAVATSLPPTPYRPGAGGKGSPRSPQHGGGGEPYGYRHRGNRPPAAPADQRSDKCCNIL
eukprot:TRINITY_DN8181_c0_g1_i1.p1 TRINITY_DN8181_c0_g1~~TRINITY_DN8181_c0_g1_i1.p1  ORF type:complete len:532 (+),score=158.81 TRINITY_DN8181_c0_g1_i1:78-1598(+)